MFFKAPSTLPPTPRPALQSLPDDFDDDFDFIVHADVEQANAALDSERMGTPLPPSLPADLLGLVTQAVIEGFHFLTDAVFSSNILSPLTSPVSGSWLSYPWDDTPSAPTTPTDRRTRGQ
ncbi:hypothetical protein BDN70DRAFT_321092 [Pholiota conissans]|uniref:Uncharacterized protein n=1 Tax=Pholiota conissans TaxID=109636 RepID=A0A9P6CVN1_9AGAR|nr:hypothetical protein BDN70DRAFT_321092 [Pholiota conissans]